MHPNASHGMWNTRLYRIWRGMKLRCDVRTCTGYQYYGARGIRYCDDWKTFEPFMKWATANGYSDSLTIDRINDDRGYNPTNCRWVTAKENRRNQRRMFVCKQGHNMDGANVLRNGEGRMCRECHNARQRRYYKKRTEDE